MKDKPTQTITADTKGSTSIIDIVERIQHVEAKYDLLKYTIDGWCAWPMLHSHVAVALANISMVEKDNFGFSELLALTVKDIVNLISLHRSRYLAKSYVSALAEQEGELYKDIFFDDLLLDIGDYIKIELLNSKMFLPRSKAALIKGDINLTLFRVLANALAKGGGPQYILDIAASISSCLKQELGFDMFTTRWIARILRRFYWYKKLYGWLLDRIRPEYLLLADAGEYEITAAAKERGIKVIEFQHGLIYQHHHVYSWSAYALAYKASMPIPDYIFLYGDYWKQGLATNGFWGKELRSVGSLRLDQYRKTRISNETTPIDKPCCIVLTTQATDTEKSIAFMTDFLKMAKERLMCRLYIKLHPVFENSKTLYEAAFGTDERVCVLLGSEAPSTFQLLAQADFHLSIGSTCHYEALGLGVPTIILPFTAHEILLPLYEAGHAFLAHTPQDLLDIILQHRYYKVSNDISAFYFKPNALENIKRELNLPRI